MDVTRSFHRPHLYGSQKNTPKWVRGAPKSLSGSSWRALGGSGDAPGGSRGASGGLRSTLGRLPGTPEISRSAPGVLRERFGSDFGVIFGHIGAYLGSFWSNFGAWEASSKHFLEIVKHHQKRSKVLQNQGSGGFQCHRKLFKN